MRLNVLHIKTYQMFMVITDITVKRTINVFSMVTYTDTRPLKVSYINQFSSVSLDFKCNRAPGFASH